MLSYLLVCAIGFFAGCLSGVIGTGASLILLPVLVPMFDPSRAIPVMAIAGLMANAARVVAWHKDVDWLAVLAYSLPGIPAASLGGLSLVSLPASVSGTLLGLFILLLVPLRRLVQKRNLAIGLGGLAAAGAAVGFLTGLFLSTGPLSIPAFLAFGLVKGAFLSTEAAASILVQAAKILTFRKIGILTNELLFSGLIIGSSLMAGTFFAKRYVTRLSERRFRIMMDIITLTSGLWLMFVGLHD
ncbi:sulfite exporter TauE/SafE family protein [Rhizobium ruizarguesonis]|uniref:sulfite exporter TauE/SafE family protein n=1 Tax=Rhizobium ruizarguesonis TaxID=2081791 RepID=UPI00103258BA|nr:sulfite exporter TauE/SafE family protein [Rhizobium ruizarguesonis]TAT93318.1 sulfite exporter TauE/SafE family protein [Rhizobium ruizarguesonis]TAZ25702.1 sulfite exporter TauE/SafE family protein [Rhizobium ruizarguesonis]TBD10041.1 sulfite exporter TauE/SafE family protein [Rhizobium ruizarguesonis]